MCNRNAGRLEIKSMCLLRQPQCHGNGPAARGSLWWIESLIGARGPIFFGCGVEGVHTLKAITHACAGAGVVPKQH